MLPTYKLPMIEPPPYTWKAPVLAAVDCVVLATIIRPVLNAP